MTQAMQWDDWTRNAQAVSVLLGELVTVTAEAADHPRYAAFAQLLERARAATGVDIVFVAQLVGGAPAVRPAAGDDGPECDALEEAYARRVLDARPPPPLPALPADREARRVASLLRAEPPCCLSLPVTDEQGMEHGTLCCLARPDPAQTQRARLLMRSVARRLGAALAALDNGERELAASVAQRMASSTFSAQSVMAPL